MSRLHDTFGQWVDLAKRRGDIILMDGRPATLVAVRKGPRNCKILLGNRHYLCWIDDIALVRWPGSSEWVLLDAWPAVNLDKRPGIHVTPRATAEASRNWLTVTPNPAVLHPSFQPPTLDNHTDWAESNERRWAAREQDDAAAQGMWLVPSTPPPMN